MWACHTQAGILFVLYDWHKNVFDVKNEIKEKLIKKTMGSLSAGDCAPAS